MESFSMGISVLKSRGSRFIIKSAAPLARRRRFDFEICHQRGLWIVSIATGTTDRIELESISASRDTARVNFRIEKIGKHGSNRQRANNDLRLVLINLRLISAIYRVPAEQRL